MTTSSPLRGHNFEIHGYGLTPTQCFICNEFLNGFWQEGYQCQNCSINVHDACRAQANPTCFVTHRFRETSYLSIPTCAACGQPMLGLWKQGFKCEDCGLDVHPTCRTQSSISTCRAVIPENEQINLSTPGGGSNNSTQQEQNSHPIQRRRSSLLRHAGDSHRLQKTGSSSTLIQEPLPTDFEGVKKEMKKIHDQVLEFNRKLDDEWEKNTKPGLKAQRAQLELQYNHLKQKYKDKQKDIQQLSTIRDETFKNFLKGFYQKYNPAKVKNVETVVRHYGNGSCKERELFSDLIEKYSNEPTAVAQIEHERAFGIFALGELEAALIELEDLASQVSKLKSALNTVRREVYFAPNIPWLVKGGAEGMYMGFTDAWLEEVSGTCKVAAIVCKGDSLTVNTSSSDDGYRPRVTIQLSGREDIPGSEPGLKFSARLEDFCVSGSALPISLSLRDADVFVQFDLQVSGQYDPPTEPDDMYGSWRVVEGGFKLKIHKFYVKTKNTGSLTIPDVVLGTLIQSFITLAFKKVIVLVMPPEFGQYMMAIHQHRVLRRKESSNGESETHHSHHHHHHHSEPDEGIWVSTSGGEVAEERFLKLVSHISIKQKLEFDTVDAFLTEKSLDSPIQKKALESLGLEKNQMRLLLYVQKELNLTFGNLWGVKYADWLSTIATTVAGTGQDLSRIPLLSILDFVKYYRDFLDPSNMASGMVKSKRQYVCTRLSELWQLALDMTLESVGGDIPESGITVKMKRIITKKLTAKESNLQHFDFRTFATSMGTNAKKEIYAEIEVPLFEITFAVRSTIRAGRDIALRVIGKKTSALPAHAVPRKISSNNGAGAIGKDFATAIQQDRVENNRNNSLIPNFGKTLPVQIQRASDFVLDKFRELQERYVDSVKLRIDLVAGDGNFKAGAHDIRLISPVDVGVEIGSKLVASILSKTVKHGNEGSKWLWNRKVTIEDGQFKLSVTRSNNGEATAPPKNAGGMVEALRRMGGKAAETAEKDVGEFHVTTSGLFAQMRTEQGAVTDVLSFHIRPVADPDRVEIKALGTGAMRVHTSIDTVDAGGQFATLFHFVDDFLADLAKNQAALHKARVFPKFVASFAARDSFYIETLASITVRSEASAGDLVVHSAGIDGKPVVRIKLTHNLVDTIHDLFDFIQGATKMSSPNEKD